MHERVLEQRPADIAEIDLKSLEAVPTGAFALAGAAVGLLVFAWLAMYFFVFIPRGPVG